MTDLDRLLDELDLLLAPLEIQGALPPGLPLREITRLLEPILGGRSAPYEIVSFYTRFDGLSARLPDGRPVQLPIGRSLAPLNEAANATSFYRQQAEAAVPGLASAAEDLWAQTWLALSWEGGTPHTDLAVADPSASASPIFVLDPGSTPRSIPVAASIAELVSWFVATLKQRGFQRDRASGRLISTGDMLVTGLPQAASWLIP